MGAIRNSRTILAKKKLAAVVMARAMAARMSRSRSSLRCSMRGMTVGSLATVSAAVLVSVMGQILVGAVVRFCLVLYRAGVQPGIVQPRILGSDVLQPRADFRWRYRLDHGFF